MTFAILPPPYDAAPTPVTARASLSRPFQIPRLRGLSVLAPLAIAALLAAPTCFVATTALFAPGPAWGHIVATSLGEYAATSALVLAGALIYAVAGGVGAAWLTAATRFPGSRFFAWALILPLAAPSYVVAGVYGRLLDAAGPVQSGFRALFRQQAGPNGIFDIRSPLGLAFVLGATLYPYVYLAARTAFIGQSGGLMEAARALGARPFEAFWRAALPAARPAVIAGAALVGMESLADFGAASLFGVPTLSAGVFRAWTSFGDLASAARIGLILIGFAAAFVTCERAARGRARYFAARAGAAERPFEKLRLSRTAGALAFAFCAALLAFGFVVPVGQLLLYAMAGGQWRQIPESLGLAAQSGALALLAAAVTVSIGAILASAAQASKLARAAAWAGALGYALPGAVLGVGALGAVAALRAAGWRISLVGPAALSLLFWAYAARFTAGSFGPLEARFARLGPRLAEAARTLGAGGWRRFRAIEVPLLVPAALAAGLAIFVDVSKELPATLLLRPFGLETLALRAYSYAKDERLIEAAIPALMLIAVGLVPVILMARAVSHAEAHARRGGRT